MDTPYLTPELYNILLLIAWGLIGIGAIRVLGKLDKVVVAVDSLATAVNNNHFQHGERIALLEQITRSLPELWSTTHKIDTRLSVAEEAVEKIVVYQRTQRDNE